MFVAHAAPATPRPRPGSEKRSREKRCGSTRSKMKSGSRTRFATAPTTMQRIAATGEPSERMQAERPKARCARKWKRTLMRR